MAEAIAVYHKAWGDTSWENITEYVIENPSWNSNLNNELLEFRISVIDPLDSGNSVIYIKEGDDIVVCENSSRNKVLGDSLAGMVLKANTEFITYDYDNSRWLVKYNLTIRQRDPSNTKTEYNYKTTTAINTILTEITKNNTFSNIGYYDGTFLGGSLDNESGIAKYVNKAANINIESFDYKGTALKALTELCKIAGYYWKIIYYVEQDSTYTLNLVQQIVVFDVNGLSPDGNSSWALGITEDGLKGGTIANPEYESYALTPLETATFYGEKNFSFDVNLNNLKNYIDLQALVQNGETLQNWTIDSDGKSNTYDIGVKCKDIIYVSKRIKCNIIDVTSTTVCKLPVGEAEQIVQDDTTQTVDSLTCRIVSSGTAYFRTFTISGNTITLDSAIGTLARFDDFELVHSFDLYKDGDDDNRPSYGAIKVIKPDTNAVIKFQKYTVPYEGATISVWGYPLKDNNTPRIFNDSLRHYGLREYSKKLEQPVTTTQLQEIYALFEKQSKPAKEIELKSYRPEIVQAGWSIPVNVPNFIDNQNYIVYSVDCQYITSDGQAGKPTIEQTIKLKLYANEIENILSSYNQDLNTSTPLLEPKEVQQSGTDLNIILSKNSETTSILSFTEKVIYSSNSDGNYDIYIANKDLSNITNYTNDSASNITPRFSPDGRYFAYHSDTSGQSEVYIYDLSTDTTTQVTNAKGETPDWSPDGKYLIFTSNRSGTYKLYKINADETEAGGDTPTLFANTTNPVYRPCMSPDGTKIVYQSGATTSETIRTIDTDDSNDTAIIGTRNSTPKYNFAGDTIAFMRHSPGTDIYTRTPVTSGGSDTSVAANPTYDDNDPVFTPDDNFIYYSAFGGTYYKIHRVEVDGSNDVALTTGNYNDLWAHVAKVDNRYL